MFQKGMGGQHGVVRLDDGGRDLRGGINTEVQLGFLAIVDGESFQEERSKSRSSSSSNGVEDQETLKSSAGIGKLSDSLKGDVNKLLSDGVVTSSIVVGSVFLASQQLIWVEELSIGSSSNFVDNSGFQIDEDGSRNVLSRGSLRKEGVEGISLLSNSGISRHGSIGRDSMFETIKLPTSISELDSSLSNVDGKNFSRH